MRLCPICDVALKAIEFEGVHVEGCEQCGGLWFEQHELTELTRHDITHLHELEARFWDHRADKRERHPRRCPNCGINLIPFEFKHTPGVILDGCKQCKGIWVDDGELDAIERRLEEYYRRREAAQRPAQPAVAPAGTSARRVEEAVRFMKKVACPQCGELNPKDAPSCWSCGASLIGAEKVIEHRCPTCAGYLEPTVRDGIPLEYCEDCGGLLFEEETFKDLILHKRSLMPVIDNMPDPDTDARFHNDRPMKCPNCQVNMWPNELIIPYREMYNYHSGVKARLCPLCARLWLAPGDLTQVHKGMEAWIKEEFETPL